MVTHPPHPGGSTSTLELSSSSLPPTIARCHLLLFHFYISSISSASFVSSPFTPPSNQTSFLTFNPPSLPQLNLFGVGHIVAELLVTGGFDCYYRIDTMNLLGALDSSKLVQTVLQIIFLVFIFIFIVRVGGWCGRKD